MGRRLGQHFLTDPGILDRIVDALDPGLDDIVLEIGAGTGSLTRRLALRAGRVVAIEADRALASRWRADVLQDGEVAEPASASELPLDRVRLVTGDALKLDWHGLVAGQRASREIGGGFKVVGNIPYAITSLLLDKALQPPMPLVVVFLVQAEVAVRLAAQPHSKSYGALTVGVQAVARVERLFAVRAGSFAPPPQVDSAVVRLVPLATPLIEAAERAGFRRFVSALFSQRRKQLQRILRSVLGAEAAAVYRLLTVNGVDPVARPENVDPEAMVRLYRATLR